ncbi:MAG TPA: hypothetical protein VF669_08340 [Tepidisphaeraceae bacterium]|jgi:hypothetical protein
MRLRRTHYALAVVVVATALAADRAVAAAPEQAKPAQTASLARTFAARLTTQLQRSVPSATRRLELARGNERVAAPQLAVREAASGVRLQLAPFEFRLPPPSL